MKTTYYTLLLAFLFLSCGGNETSTVEDIIAS